MFVPSLNFTLYSLLIDVARMVGYSFKEIFVKTVHVTCQKYPVLVFLLFKQFGKPFQTKCWYPCLYFQIDQKKRFFDLSSSPSLKVALYSFYSFSLTCQGYHIGRCTKRQTFFDKNRV